MQRIFGCTNIYRCLHITAQRQNYTILIQCLLSDVANLVWLFFVSNVGFVIKRAAVTLERCVYVAQYKELILCIFVQEHIKRQACHLAR